MILCTLALTLILSQGVYSQDTSEIVILRGIPTKEYDADYRRLNIELRELSGKIAEKLIASGVNALPVSPTEIKEMLKK